MWKHYLAGGLISLAAVYFFLRAVPLAEMGRALAGMKLIYLLPCLALYIVSYVFRALRWHYLMRPVARVSFKPLFAALMIGFLGNNILPAHLGEFARAFVLGRHEKVSASATFATIVLERVYDGLTVLFLLLLVLLFMDLPEGRVAGSVITLDGLRLAGWLGLLLFAGLLVLLQALRWQRQRCLRLCGYCCRPLPARWGERLVSMLDAFADGLSLARASDLCFVALYSLLTWVLLGLWAWSLFPAFGLSLGPMAGMLMEVVVALALLIPSAPAFVGTFHLAAAATLGFMGAAAGIAGSYAMALWLVHFVSTSLLGLFYLWRLGLGLSALKDGRA
jgi:uncharacterized protein (TIRG00374 family)